MVRMLFLRDIDTDVDIRCRVCGHGGVLGHAMLVRRFGPNYPVLSLAPHYRCSRCDSRDTECRPAQPPEPLALPEAEEPDENAAVFDATIAALRGLVDAAHDSRTGPAAASAADRGDADLDGPDLDDMDPDDTVVRPRDREPLWDDLAASPPPRDEDEREPDPLPEHGPADAGFPPEFAALFERAYADDPDEDEEPATPPRDRPVFSMGWDDDDADGTDPDEGEDRDRPGAETVRRSPDDMMDDPGEDAEPSEAEILSFAIRDRDEHVAPRSRRPAHAAEEDDSDATLSMQRTLAALRGMIESAAAEPGDLPPPPKAPPPHPPAKPAPAGGAASLDDTLAKLRGLLDLDAPGEDSGGRDDNRPPGARRR